MSSINVTRFVDINIIHHITPEVISTRDTTILFTTEGEGETDKVIGIYDNLESWTSSGLATSMTNTDIYARVYFNNGGRVLKIIKTTSTTLADSIKKLNDDEIVIAYCDSTDSYTPMETAATARKSDSSIYGVNQKILLARVKTTEQIKNVNISNFAVKYSHLMGAEMTIAAYLSNIDVYGINTIKDYAFTIETGYIDNGGTTYSIEETDETVSDITLDDLLGKVIENNMNVDMMLAGQVRNLGGNLTDGNDIMNQFTLIVLHQTLTDRLLNLLSGKIKGNSGLASIYTALAGELNRYVTNGYLTTDKIWTDGDKIINYNGKNYTLIQNNTPLTLGYHISILPLTSLTVEDKAERKTPPIYVFIADSYGIRKIVVNGEVI